MSVLECLEIEDFVCHQPLWEQELGSYNNLYICEPDEYPAPPNFKPSISSWEKECFEHGLNFHANIKQGNANIFWDNPARILRTGREIDKKGYWRSFMGA